MFPYSLDVENGTVTIKEKFSKFVEEYKSKKELLKSDVPNIFCGHFGVNGAIMSQYNIIDSATSLKTNMGFVNSSTKDISLTDLDSIGCDFVFLGDYHQYQKLDTKTPSFYSGALERMDFGEINEDKGFIIMDVDTKTLFFEKNENCRPMYNLVGNFSDIEEQYSKIQPTTNRPIIKITFIGTSEDKYVFNTSIDVFCQKIIKEFNPIHLFTDSKIISSPLKPGDIFDEDIIEDKLFSSSQSVSSITKADIMTISRDILSGLNEDSIVIKRAIELSETYYKELT
jgi:DNA repair exonuclease SbcCD nuclease subunit